MDSSKTRIWRNGLAGLSGAVSKERLQPSISQACSTQILPIEQLLSGLQTPTAPFLPRHATSTSATSELPSPEQARAAASGDGSAAAQRGSELSLAAAKRAARRVTGGSVSASPLRRRNPWVVLLGALALFALLASVLKAHG